MPARLLAVLSVAADPRPTGWHAPSAAADLAALRGAWFKPGATAEPGVDLQFGTDSVQSVGIALVLPPRPGRPDLLTETAEFRVTAPGRMLVIRGDSAAEVRFRVDGGALTLDGEFPPRPGEGVVRFTGTYNRRATDNGPR